MPTKELYGNSSILTMVPDTTDSLNAAKAASGTIAKRFGHFWFMRLNPLVPIGQKLMTRPNLQA